MPTVSGARATESQVVNMFDGDHPPTFRQGAPKHELEELVTAEQCEHMTRRIVELEKTSG